jgi:copper chaperone CopZ
MKSTLNVVGMTCGHCENAVTAELLKINGVTGVTVDLDSQKVTVDSVEVLAENSLKQAIDEAGYELVSIR